MTVCLRLFNIVVVLQFGLQAFLDVFAILGRLLVQRLRKPCLYSQLFDKQCEGVRVNVLLDPVQDVPVAVVPPVKNDSLDVLEIVFRVELVRRSPVKYLVLTVVGRNVSQTLFLLPDSC